MTALYFYFSWKLSKCSLTFFCEKRIADSIISSKKDAYVSIYTSCRWMDISSLLLTWSISVTEKSSTCSASVLRKTAFSSRVNVRSLSLVETCCYQKQNENLWQFNTTVINSTHWIQNRWSNDLITGVDKSFKVAFLFSARRPDTQAIFTYLKSRRNGI